jgi:hypothetical protein
MEAAVEELGLMALQAQLELVEMAEMVLHLR